MSIQINTHRLIHREISYSHLGLFFNKFLCDVFVIWFAIELRSYCDLDWNMANRLKRKANMEMHKITQSLMLQLPCSIEGNIFFSLLSLSFSLCMLIDALWQTPLLFSLSYACQMYWTKGCQKNYKPKSISKRATSDRLSKRTFAHRQGQNHQEQHIENETAHKMKIWIIL